MKKVAAFMIGILPAHFFLLLFAPCFLFAQSATLELPKNCKENYFTTSDNVRIRYVVAGKGDALILIPGWTMPAEIWEKQLEYFSRTHMVIAIDPRCQGKSEKTTEGLHFDREAQDVSELASHLRLNAYYLIGWSWAGPMMCSYLKNFDAPALKGIVFVDCPVKFTEVFLTRVAGMTTGLFKDRKNFTPVFVKGLFLNPQPDAYVEKLGKASMMTPTSSAVALLANFLVNSDAEYLQTIKTASKPLLFFVAKGKEPVYEELKKEMRLNYVVVPDAGHTPFVENPAVFNKILQEFIATHTNSQARQ